MTDIEKDYYLRGTFFYYSRMTPVGIYRWKENVSLPLLQECANNVIQKYPIVRVSLDRKSKSPLLVEAVGDFKVHDSFKKREYPENAGGYMFSISCVGNKVYFEFDHFLTDGYGFGWIEKEIFFEYCQKMYGVQPPTYNPLLSKTLPPFEKMLSKCSSDDYKENKARSFAEPLMPSCQLKRFLLRVKKQSFIDCAMKLKVKPSSLYVGLLCYAAMKTTDKAQIPFQFAFDARTAVNCIDAFAHSSANLLGTVIWDSNIHSFVSGVHLKLTEMLSLENRKHTYGTWLKSSDELASLQAPYEVKKAAVHKFENMYSSGICFSYLGDYYTGTTAYLKEYIEDVQGWAETDQSWAYCLETSLRDQMIFTVSHRLDNVQFLNCIEELLKSLDITIIKITNIDAETFEEEK